MSFASMAVRQARYETISFWRNPASAFFTVVFPLLFLVIFNSVLGEGDISVKGGTVDTSTFYVPAILAFAVISATYTNIAMSVTFARDRGLLKRVRGTPLPSLAYILGRIIQAVGVTFLLVVVVLFCGIVFYGVNLDASKIALLIVALILGAGCFCTLGLAITGFVPNADAAPAVVNASILPLLFISNVFIPTEQAPGWINSFASIFPVRPFADSLFAVFNPLQSGSGFDVKDLILMAAWGLVGIALALRYFSWEPRK
ncbi:MAG TPA: ABC transporter permease [Dehalococcoidia bacterium]|nr:ABC transporter permease [Dehalococcoidia bacterium]